MATTSINENIESYIKLVHHTVRSEMRKIGISKQSMEEELEAYGMEGLLMAAQQFDPNRGVSFVSYAAKRIRWSVYDGLRSMGWFTSYNASKIKFVCKAEEMLEAKSSDPKPHNKAEAVQRLSDTVRELVTAYIVQYCEESPPKESIHNNEAEQQIDQNRCKAVLRAYVFSLPKIQSTIIQQFFFENRKLKDIAVDMNITISWASKLMSTALRSLRNMCENNLPQQ